MSVTSHPQVRLDGEPQFRIVVVPRGPRMTCRRPGHPCLLGSGGKHLGARVPPSSPSCPGTPPRPFPAWAPSGWTRPLLPPTDRCQTPDGRVLSRPSSRVHEPRTLYRGG